MRRVNFRLDHDVILAASEGRFRSIRLVVAGGDLELFDVKITFGDGETFSPATRLYFKENSRSRTIDLRVPRGSFGGSTSITGACRAAVRAGRRCTCMAGGDASTRT